MQVAAGLQVEDIERTPVRRGGQTFEKSGGGEDVAHSSVLASHGSSPATSFFFALA